MVSCCCWNIFCFCKLINLNQIDCRRWRWRNDRRKRFWNHTCLQISIIAYSYCNHNGYVGGFAGAAWQFAFVYYIINLKLKVIETHICRMAALTYGQTDTGGNIDLIHERRTVRRHWLDLAWIFCFCKSLEELIWILLKSYN